MQVVMKCSKEVYEKLISFNKCDAITNFNNSYSPRAYEILKKVSGMDNFFFAMKDTGVKDLEDIISNSNINNIIELVLNVPDHLVFQCAYYDFTDLIYYLEYEYDSITVKNLTDKIAQQNKENNEDYVQIIMPYILKDWLIN